MSSSPARSRGSPGTTPGSNSPRSESGLVLTPATSVEDLVSQGLGSGNDADEYVLVTGGLGFIGSHTSLELLKAGYNIVIVDNLSNSYREVFERILLAAKLHYAQHIEKSCPRAELCCIDYRDAIGMNLLLDRHTIRTSTSRTSNITGVIHFAAYKEVADSIKHPLKYYQNNVQGLIEFLALLDEHAIRTFIFSSSASVYGTLSESESSAAGLREEDCVHERTTYFDATGTQHSEPGCTGITNPYGRTKFMAEAILSDVAKSDLAWTAVALRYFNPIGCDASGLLGEDPRQSASNLFPAAVKALTGETPDLYIYGDDWNTADGSAIRDFIHVTDLARGHTAALEAARGGMVGGCFRTFNLGTGTGHSVYEVVRELEGVSGRSIPVRVVGRRDGDVGVCVAVPERAQRELGWTAQRGLREACVDMWEYLRGKDSI
ncbi:uncharacterized protein DSM5745_08518 [Aspergillus mulundensis]|uniref:NAD-dependent epimerase/dehydratase domain-containing protein n=1 Tax=Aspergillus mulundensis TaxID=1810919 RepID=A0A3D8R468_9EURO|nr:Uncharacterized protein DSM5745_08518 [Aspergillus mulundensis]RDW68758.1 Uncharacterized protein DSM5745_08518 [Aspergillus mulundensis]